MGDWRSKTLDKSTYNFKAIRDPFPLLILEYFVSDTDLAAKYLLFRLLVLRHRGVDTKTLFKES